MFVVKVQIKDEIFFGICITNGMLKYTHTLKEAKIFKNRNAAKSAYNRWKQLYIVQDAKIIKLKQKVT